MNESNRPAGSDSTNSLETSGLAGRLQEGLRTRSARIGIVGLGYVGLPLARAFTTAKFNVVGFDVDPEKTEHLLRGESYIKQIAPEWIRKTVDEGRFDATVDFARLADVEVIIVCVPTPLTAARAPDLSYIRDTSETISQTLRRGQLVVLESTTYPGTTEEVVQPILESTGLQAGSDFFLAYSPEREDPGNRDFSTETIPKLVGGIDATSGTLARLVYEPCVSQVIEVAHARVAEAAKILENIYRSVNIALVNELKVVFDSMGVNVWEVIAAAATKPFGYEAFYPGPGLGGHCIPIDPFYLTWKARECGMSTRFIELAGEINTQMPAYVVDRLAEAMDRRHRPLHGSSGLVIGVAYKRDVDDVRESPAFEIIRKIQERGSVVDYHDPFVPRLKPVRKYRLDLQSVPLTAEELRSRDYAVIVTDHSGIDWSLVVENSPLVIDTRNATAGVMEGRDNVIRA